jgi:hypothetical protein
MTQSPTGPAGWPAADLTALLAEWWKPFLAAPQQLSQPILPGWTVGPSLTINNSTSPQTEVDVVQRHSYGRQLGRIIDVLQVLLGEGGDDAEDPRVTDFRTMVTEIDEVKLDSAARRVARLSDDLRALRDGGREAEYQRLRAALRAALDQT